MTTLALRVVYPLPPGARLVLRSELDWDKDQEPATVDAANNTTVFRVEIDGPFLYFKPCLRTADGGFHWSVGSNYLALNAAPFARDLYPHFHGSSNGAITERRFAAHPDGSRRPYRVYLPPGYWENTLKRYPVLYMHDGANLFFPQEAFLGQDWQVDATLDLLDSMNLIDRVMVVGVYAADRMNEYTKPGYETYGRFLVESLKPAIDADFRTLPGPQHTAVMGSSLGGVVSMFLGWHHSATFGKAACLSSTFGYRDDLFQRVSSEPKRALQIYLDSGWPGDNYEETLTMRDRLIKRGYVPGKNLLSFAFPNAEHNEAAWAVRSHIPFQFFFGKVPRLP